jgi:hypothetical protein
MDGGREVERERGRWHALNGKHHSKPHREIVLENPTHAHVGVHNKKNTQLDRLPGVESGPQHGYPGSAGVSMSAPNQNISLAESMMESVLQHKSSSTYQSLLLGLNLHRSVFDH